MIKTSGNKSLVQYQLSVLLLLIFALFSCKGDDDEIVGPVPSGPRDGILYVEEGGTGDGSIEEPFGSIQRALETAFRNPEFRTINVATGEYIGSPRVRSGVTINGSLDSDNEWTLSSSERTVILGSKIDSLVVGLMVRNLSRTVILNHVTIMGGNADDSGASSIGLYCQDAGDVRLNECEVISGNGMVGSAGTIGDFGSNGEDADGQNTGGSSAVGGRGGDGGVRDILQQVPGSFGEDGFCIGNANGGGLGGEVSTGENGLPGENGPAGSGSVAGNGALSQIAIEAAGPYLVFRTGNGETGLTGQYGCGGGGGSGSSSIWNPDPNFSFVGSPGGGGGSGGVPGNGGEGAEGGGCAVAVFSFASTLMLTNCTLISGDGAIGGTGGLGGQGGIGGKGGFVPSAVLVGGTGGDGGAGGAGGNGGGGGNGGWSIGLANSTSTIDTTNVTIFLGQPGLGGLGDGSAASQGASGQQLPGSDLP